MNAKLTLHNRVVSLTEKFSGSPQNSSHFLRSFSFAGNRKKLIFLKPLVVQFEQNGKQHFIMDNLTRILVKQPS